MLPFLILQCNSMTIQPEGTVLPNNINFPTQERWCGGSLTCDAGGTVSETIVSQSGPPFHLWVNTNDREEAAALTNENRGFRLDYFQRPCEAN